MHIVDAHLHLMTGQSPEETCEPRMLMEPGVINRAWLLSANGFTGGHGTDAEILALCRRYPDYFVPFGYLDFRKDAEHIEHLYRQGFVGLKAIWPEEPYDSARYFPLYERAEALHMPILFHVGGAYYAGNVKPKTPDSCVISLEQTYGRNMMPIHMDAIAKRCPRLVIVMAHMGGDIPYFEQSSLICRGHAGMRGRAMMYMDLSSDLTYYSVAALDKVKQVIEDVGPRCILFGSDAPWQSAAEVARFWRFFLTKTMRLKEEDVAKIMGLNAEEIIREAVKHRPVHATAGTKAE